MKKEKKSNSSKRLNFFRILKKLHKHTAKTKNVNEYKKNY